MEAIYPSVTYAILLFIIFLIIGYCVYYLVVAVKRPLVACKEGPWLDFLKAKLPLLQKAYWPTPWCLDGRFQTIFGIVTRYWLPPIQYQREILNMKDGGIVVLDWFRKPKASGQPIITLLPGLTGSSQSEYIKGLINNISDMEYISIVIFNHRGMAGAELKTTRAYCGANSDDFEEAVECIHSTYPQSPILATGISLGGMVIGNYLVTRREKAAEYLVAAMVFSVPLNLSVTTETLERPILNLLFNYMMTRALKKLFRRFKSRLDGEEHPWKYDHLMKSKTIREFDDRFTALNFGYRDVEEYYGAASLHDKLHNIKIPFLCLTSADDFFMPMKGIPMAEVNSSSHVAMVVTSRGGHVGFLEGLNPIQTCYSDRLYRQFVHGVFSNIQDVKRIQKEGNYFNKVMTNGT